MHVFWHIKCLFLSGFVLHVDCCLVSYVQSFSFGTVYNNV